MKKKSTTTEIQGFKGYDKNFKCRDMQYEIGKDYETKEKPVRCTEHGYHFCTNPFDVFGYYPPSQSRFGEVTGSGDVSADESDTKVAVSKIHIGSDTKVAVSKIHIGSDTKVAVSKIHIGSDTKVAVSKIHIGAEISLHDFITKGTRFIFEKTTLTKEKTNTEPKLQASNSGDSGAASNSGDRGAASNSGDRGAASNSGDSGAASNSGYRGAASNSGYRGAASNSGDSGAASNSGDRGAASNSGDSGAAFSVGYNSSSETTGEKSIACAVGINNKAKGDLGCWLVLSEYKEGNNYTWHLKYVKSVLVDGKKIKANTFYYLINGKFLKA
jgi:hypothetical protein